MHRIQAKFPMFVSHSVRLLFVYLVRDILAFVFCVFKEAPSALSYTIIIYNVTPINSLTSTRHCQCIHNNIHNTHFVRRPNGRALIKNPTKISNIIFALLCNVPRWRRTPASLFEYILQNCDGQNTDSWDAYPYTAWRACNSSAGAFCVRSQCYKDVNIRNVKQ